jgi:hypothetical protein
MDHVARLLPLVRSATIAAVAYASLVLPVLADAPSAPPLVPPERAARPVASVPLANPGFESAAPGRLGAPDGWWGIQHAGPLSYTFTPDTDAPRSGGRSLRIDNIGPEPFGTLYQVVPAAALRGKTLRFSAWLRTRDAKGNVYGSGAGLKLQTMRGGYIVDHVHMRMDSVGGTTDWARYELHLKVANAAEQIEVGVNLFGPGAVWIDDVALDVVEPPSVAAATPAAAADTAKPALQRVYP